MLAEVTERGTKCRMPSDQARRLPFTRLRTVGAASRSVNIVGAGLVPAPDGATTRVARTLGDVIGAFKSLVTVEYTRHVKRHGWPPFAGRLWQRNYYEHIIRNDNEMHHLREYIVNNPAQWDLDRENPDNPNAGKYESEIAEMQAEVGM